MLLPEQVPKCSRELRITNGTRNQTPLASLARQ